MQPAMTMYNLKNAINRAIETLRDLKLIMITNPPGQSGLVTNLLVYLNSDLSLIQEVGNDPTIKSTISAEATSFLAGIAGYPAPFSMPTNGDTGILNGLLSCIMSLRNDLIGS